MSNPLNNFAYSDRMRPTHNPIKVKSIAFDDTKKIREVDRGNSRLEIEPTLLSAQNRHNEMISAGSGPTSQSRPTVQN